MRARPEELKAIVENIWSSLLGLQVRPVALPDPQASAPWHEEGELTGCVHITGGWDGAVVLACPTSLVRKAAVAMFDQPESEIGAGDMQDALAELTNIAAGNIKSFCPAESHASLPTLVDGRCYRLIVVDSRAIAQLAFESEGATFELTVLEKLPG
jgi:CheY-specific phosphatase CheX